MNSYRRNFLLATAAAAPVYLQAAQGTKAIKVGLVGAGGRGSGAALQALKADDYAELTAVADLDLPIINESLARLKRAAGDKVKVEEAKKFTGLDAYAKLLASDVDVVILATPPGFRPQHYRAAVEANKHLFVEKPIAVDGPGVRSVMETTKLAKEKKLCVVSGFCWRYSNYIRATFEQMQQGAIGELVSYYGTYLSNPVKPMPPASARPAGISDVEWQLRNWYNFGWVCGDGLVEQGIHTVDKVQWAFGDETPISCTAVGGRSIPAEGGNIFDHIEVNYLYSKNRRAHVVHRQIPGCHNENGDYILGTKGSVTIGRGPLPRIDGANPWTYEGQKNDMYQYEHDVLFAAIRKGEAHNDGDRMAVSTMVGIMGRMAAYTGQQITYEQALNSQEHLFPEKLDWSGRMDVLPLARPGVTKFF